jgi:seryl-tRNA synthetase
MHDIRYIRENPEAFDRAMARRGIDPVSADILSLDSERRAAQTSFQEGQAKRNELSKKIGEIKKAKGDATEVMNEVASLKDSLSALEEKERDLGAKLDDKMSRLPNILADEVPVGKDDTQSREERRIGVPRPIENPKQHFELGEALGLMDIPAAAKVSGARFTFLTGSLARLERALGDFMLNLHTTEFGYTEVSPPLLVNDDTVFGTGQLPKFAEDLFRATTGHWLIPTAEVPLTNMVRGEILDREKLPIRLTARTACFRSEAGSAGKDTRGMLRQHQFYKVEMVSITAPDQSVTEHERMVSCAEEVLKRLELPYRVVTLCTGDTGFTSRKTYDIEVWLPGQNTYREISSCSNCWDFQGRRMNARCRKAGDKNTEFVHTLNGSGIAIGRALIAVMENYQQPDGSIVIPDALKSYMGGIAKIEVPSK